MQFSILSPDEADMVKAGTVRKAWLQAILDGDTIKADARPSLSAKDKASLDERGLKMRTRYASSDKDDPSVYVWIEGLTSPDDLVTMPGIEEDDEVPL